MDQKKASGKTVYEEIRETVKQHDVVICAAGMATRVLAKRFWKDGVRTTFIDIGSIADALASNDTRTWIRLVGADLVKSYSDVFMRRNTDIVVLTHGQEQVSKSCFESIRKHTNDYRVIWVDNGSTKESLDVVKASAATLKECDLIRSESNLGFSRGVNLALRKIFYERKSDYIALVNNDVIVPPDWLDHMITTMEANGFVALGPLTSENNPHALDALRKVVPDLPVFETKDTVERATTLWNQFGTRALEAGNMMSFFCCVLKRQAMEQIGLLDENIFAYGEDNDYFERMRRLGMKFGIGLGCYVHHDHHVTSAGFGANWIETRKREAAEYLKKKYAGD